MKTRFSTKLLSFLLAVMMIVTSVPMVSLTAAAAENNKFLMVYFTGNGNTVTGQNETQAIRFAVSTDGLNFTPLNNNISVIKQKYGTKNCRDPYIFMGQDNNYYIIATDMNCETGWWGNSNSFVIWKSSDLVNWTDETIISLPQILGYADDQVWRAWAPQIAWDASANKYMVYFALAAANYQDYGDNNNTHMYYMYCDDLLNQGTYSKPQPLFDTSVDTYKFNNIDADITYDSATNKYYMFYKDERSDQKYILYATSNKLNGPYSGTTRVSDTKLEGCQLYQLNDGSYILASDDYSENGHFVLYQGNSINNIATKNYTTRSEDFSNCVVRHGSFLKISNSEYYNLLSKDWSSEPTPSGEGVDLTSDLIAQYLVNDTTTDATGHGYNLTQSGSVAWDSNGYNNSLGAATFTSNNYLYNNRLADMFSSSNMDKGITISFLAKPNSNNSWSSGDGGGRFFELTNMGTKGTLDWNTNRNDARYISMSFNSHMEVYQNWDTRVTADGALFNEQWRQYTVTVKAGQLVLYIDGEEFYSINDSKVASVLLDSWKQGGYLLIGASAWPDSTLNGAMRDVRIFNRAITADEASRLPMQYRLDYQQSVDSASAVFEDAVAHWDYTRRFSSFGSGSNGGDIESPVRDIINNLSMRSIDWSSSWSYTNGGATSADAYLYANGFGSYLNNSKGVKISFDITINNHKSNNYGLFALGTNHDSGFNNIIKVERNGDTSYNNTYVCNIGELGARDYHVEIILSENKSLDMVVNGVRYHLADNCTYTPQQFNHIAIGVCENTNYPGITVKTLTIKTLQTISGIKNAMAFYEAKMNNDTLYTNMSNAYDAYVAANKAYDAYYYGNNQGVDLADAVNKLAIETSKMLPWKAYVGNSVGNAFIHKNTKYGTSENYFRNILYVNAVDADSASANRDRNNNDKNLTTYLRVPEVTMLYDGTNAPFAPIMLVISSSKTNRQVYAIELATDYDDGINYDLSLTQGWNGKQGTGDGWQFETVNGQSGYTSMTKSNGKAFALSNKTTGFANFMQFTGNFGTNEYLRTTVPTVDIYAGSNSTLNYNDIIQVMTSSTPVRIVNYKAVLDTINANKSKLKNVANYKEGGLADVIAGFEEAMTDPNSFFTSSNNYTACEQSFKSACEFMKGNGTVDNSEYQKLRDAMDAYNTNVNGNYSAASRVEYTKIYTAAQTVMADVINRGYVNPAKCTADVNAMNSVLNTEISKSGLNSAIASKKNSTSIFDANGNQIYTLSDYDKFAQALNNEQTTVNNTTYLTKNVVTGNYSSISDDTLTYSKTTDNSTAYNDELAKINAIAISGSVDDAYYNYEAAKIVAASMDTNKFTAESLAILDDIIAQQEAIAYTTVTNEISAKYSPMLDGVNKVKALASGVDECTRAVLEAVNSLELGSIENSSGNIISTINTFKSYITIQDEEGNTYGDPHQFVSEAKYGETFVINADSFEQLKDVKNIKWGITLYEKDSDIPVASQRVSSYDGIVLERVANYDVHVTAEIMSETANNNYYIVKFLNGYGNVIEIKYLPDMPTEADLKDVSTSMAFYTFDGWNEPKAVGDNEYVVKPKFVAQTEYVDIAVIGGTVNKTKVEVNKTVTVTADNTENMIGWAVKNGNKYQVVAYGTDDYSFVTIVSEVYCPIYFDGTNYTANGVILTADTLDYGVNTYSKPADVTTLDTQAFINDKLATKSPFIYVEGIDRGSEKTKIVLRVTKNSDEKILAYGLTITRLNEQNEIVPVNYNATTKNEAGQVIMTVKNVTFDKYITFGGFVTYTYTYNDKGVTASVNTTDIYVK